MSRINTYYFKAWQENFLTNKPKEVQLRSERLLAQALEENITLTKCDIDINDPIIKSYLERNNKIAKYRQEVVDFITGPKVEVIPIIHNDSDYNTTSFCGEGVDVKQMQEKVAKKLLNTIFATDAEIDKEKLR